MKRTLRKVLVKLKLIPASTSGYVQRMDLSEIPICDNLSFLVYWKILYIGKGPAVVLKAFDKEILKFDCFGEMDGHYHIAPDYNSRIYFTEKTALEQIERTVSELRINGRRYLGLQEDSNIRQIRPNPAQYDSAVDSVEKLLIHFHRNVKDIQ